MADDGFVLLDTRCFDQAIAMRPSLVQQYEKIDTTYTETVETLLKNWKGRGAEAFADDARTVKTNITGIFEILKVMCDTLEDCREVFAECDKSLGDYNRNPPEGG